MVAAVELERLLEQLLEEAPRSTMRRTLDEREREEHWRLKRIVARRRHQGERDDERPEPAAGTRARSPRAGRGHLIENQCEASRPRGRVTSVAGGALERARLVSTAVSCSVALACASGPLPRPLSAARLYSVEGPDVALVAELDRRGAEEVAGLMAAARMAALNGTGLASAGLPPLRALLLDPNETGRLLPAGQDGLVAEGLGGSPVLLGATSRSLAARARWMHAAAHATLDAVGLVGPRWLHEGLACRAESVVWLEGESPMVADPSEQRLAPLAAAGAPGPEVLLEEQVDEAKRPAFEAWSCLLVERLARSSAPFKRLVEALQGGAPAAEAVAASYEGRTLAEAVRDLRSARRIRSERLSPIGKPRPQGAARPVDTHAVLRARAQGWLLALRLFPPVPLGARPLSDWLRAVEPHAPESLALEVALGEPGDTRLAHATAAATARPRDPLLLWLLSREVPLPERAPVLDAVVALGAPPAALRSYAEALAMAAPEASLQAALAAEQGGDPEGAAALLNAQRAAATGRCADSAAALARASLRARDGAPWSAALLAAAAQAPVCAPAAGARSAAPLAPAPPALRASAACSGREIQVPSGARGLALVRLTLDDAGVVSVAEAVYGPAPLRDPARALLAACRFEPGQARTTVVPVVVLDGGQQ